MWSGFEELSAIAHNSRKNVVTEGEGIAIMMKMMPYWEEIQNGKSDYSEPQSTKEQNR